MAVSFGLGKFCFCLTGYTGFLVYCEYPGYGLGALLQAILWLGHAVAVLYICFVFFFSDMG